MTHYLGIDGGGTRCRARVRDAQGALVGEAEGDLANIYQDFGLALASILATARRAAPDVPPDRIHAGLGLAGATGPEQCAQVELAGLPFASVKVDSDGYIACLGAHGGGDGGIVIAGTGSAGFAILGGKRLSIGGHGFMLGDQGSGAVLGRAAMQHALLAHDGMVGRTAWSDALMARFQHRSSAAVAWSRTALSRDYAVFAPELLAAAATGEAAALALVMQAGTGLANLALRLQAAGARRLCLVGGLGAAVLPYMPPEIAALFAPPLSDPLEGAIMMARAAVAAA